MSLFDTVALCRLGDHVPDSSPSLCCAEAPCAGVHAASSLGRKAWLSFETLKLLCSVG